MPNTNIGFRIDDNLLAQVDALAEQLGQTRTDVITEALHQRLGLGQGSTVEQRLADVEQRLASVERLLGEVGAAAPPGQTSAKEPPPAKVAQKQPRENAQQGASKPVEVSQGLTESHPKANGQRWLSTGQAVEVSRGRGGPGNRATLLRWADDGKLGAIGLRYCPHGTKRNDLASFEDLQAGG